MDDFTQPDSEFDAAYRELQVVNRMLGGIRAIRRFLPPDSDLRILDVAAGASDIGEELLRRRPCRIVALDLNVRGLRFARRSWPLVGDALALPFRDGAFDVVMASLFFHHLSNESAVRVLAEMWRVTQGRILVNDLHRTRVAYYSFKLLSSLFSKSRMVRHDGPISVLRAFRPAELMELARRAGIPARVHRSFPYRLVLAADK